MITKQGKKIAVDSHLIRSQPPTDKYLPHKMTVARNALKTTLQHYDEHKCMGVGIELPFGMQGNAVQLAMRVGIYMPVIYDTWKTFKIPVHLLSQASVKAFATQKKGAKKSDLVLRAAEEWKFKANTEDEVEAFWMALFVFCLSNKPKLLWREAVVTRFKKNKKNHPLEAPEYEWS